jgi:hypothetical protein
VSLTDPGRSAFTVREQTVIDRLYLNHQDLARAVGPA